MAPVFMDASVYAKGFIEEPGSAWVRERFEKDPPEDVVISRLSGAEVASALARSLREKRISEASRQSVLQELAFDLGGRLRVVEISPKVVDRAILLVGRYPLRASDAVQLAAALETNDVRLALSMSPLSFACADDRLLQAAQGEGLAVIDPAHPSPPSPA